METVNIHDAKTNLSRLIERVSQGESVIIAKAGKPMVKLVPLSESERLPVRRIGFMDGEIDVPEDFDSMGADLITDMFEGRS